MDQIRRTTTGIAPPETIVQTMPGTGAKPLYPAPPSEFDGGGVSSVLLLILDLAGGNINDQFAELDRVAWAFETLGRHSAIMARTALIRNPARNLLQFKLTHYQMLSGPQKP